MLGLLLEHDLMTYWVRRTRENEAQRLGQGVPFLQTVVGTYDGEDWGKQFFLCGSMSEVHFWICYDGMLSVK